MCWAYRSVLQTFMAFSVRHTHAEHVGFSHVVLYYITVNVKKLLSILLQLYMQLEFYPLGERFVTLLHQQIQHTNTLTNSTPSAIVGNARS